MTQVKTAGPVKLLSTSLEKKIITGYEDGSASMGSSEATIFVDVKNKERFLAYINKRDSDRESTDPRDMIKGCRPIKEGHSRASAKVTVVRKAIKGLRSRPRDPRWTH